VDVEVVPTVPTSVTNVVIVVARMTVMACNGSLHCWEKVCVCGVGGDWVVDSEQKRR
jgi:hypothetical protein